ncbi:MAG: nucleotidyltransferase family protein [Nanoarchaeota archaeon]
MAYTEIKHKNGKRYFYRVKSIREGKKFKKERIYLGKGLSKEELNLKEKKADFSLNEKKRLVALNKIIPKIRRILKKNKVKKAGIFGSYAKGEQKKNSDIDILIELPKGIGFGFVGIQFELEDKLGKKVDLVTYKYLSPYLKENILKSEVRII